MIKVSDILSKQLICLDTAQIVGTIGNIVFDERLSCGKQLVLFCEDDIDPEVKFVDLKNVFALSGDAGVVRSCDFITYEWNTGAQENNPINCTCFNQDGKLLGIVRDIVLDGAKVIKILIDGAELSPKDLLSYSDKLLIFNDSGKPIKLRSKPKIPAPTSVQSIELHNAAAIASTENKTTAPVLIAKAAAPMVANARPLSQPGGATTLAELRDIAERNLIATQSKIEDSEQDEPLHDSSSEIKPPEKIDIPSKILQDNTLVHHSPAPDSGEIENSYKFLLGKPVQSDICANDGKILIAANTLVTIDTIRTARLSGKLVQLALRAY